MVHLTAIPHANGKGPSKTTASRKLVDTTKSLLQLSTDADDYSTSVYGSRFAAEDLPRNEIPEGQMPPNVAYRMIKDDLSLDNNPKLKSALP
ncbi:hypothetical protein DCS_08101 [Drechmeria coniospora]|uniref:glutamate decarboxylase n=1 Tax=Drechmeria coniospora TaxID=98403 RepID=A0A151GGC3_DRECN|nr:hypothetical protein DCS_08101 [Drechmeria coniospora]KYK56134.1 hypothetical protein DCS_08101 [Drechmeria coniospora]